MKKPEYIINSQVILREINFFSNDLFLYLVTPAMTASFILYKMSTHR